MRKLFYIFVFCALLIGCEHIRKIYNERGVVDTLEFIDYDYIDESPVDTEVLSKIYNAKTMVDVFPTDTLNEGLSYDETFN